MMGGVNDLVLYSIDSVANTKQLFTGLAYRLEHPSNDALALAWDEENQVFKFTEAQTIEKMSIFFLLHSGYGYFLLRNNLLGEKNIVVQCSGTPGKVICWITDGTRKMENPYPNLNPIYYAYLPIQLNAVQEANIYQLDNP